MRKNDRLINSLKKVAQRNKVDNIKKASEQVLPQIYAALAIALHREFGFGCDRISRVIKSSQDIWTDFTGTGEDMIKWCEDETGVCLAYKEPED